MKASTRSVASIDDYIQAAPVEVQAMLTKLRAAVVSAAPKATEKISYQMPTFYYLGNLVHFAAFKQHIGFYPTPSAIMAFADELAPYATSKGAVQFPLDQPLPLKLVKKMVEFRVKENEKKKAKPAKKK